MNIWKVSQSPLYFNDEENEDLYKRNCVCVHPATPAKGKSYSTQGEDFSNVEKGDFFYLCYGNKCIRLFGMFTGERQPSKLENKPDWLEQKYIPYFESNSNEKYQGDTAWWTPSDNSTFTKCKNNEDFQEWILKPFFSKTLKDIEMMTGIEKYVNLLKTNHNLILTGAPGTGKTYLAKQIAKQMIFGENKEKLTNEERILLNERCHFVQFHPSYDYTDFVEGLRPINDKGNVGFERKDGAFKDFCKIALSYNTKIEDIEGRVVKNQSMVDEKIETIKLRILNFLEKNKSTEYEYNNGMILYRFDRQVGDDLIFSARWKNPASRLPQNIVTINMPIFIKYVLFDIYLQDELPENHKDYIENKYVWAYYENFENEIMSDDEINQLIYETRDLIESRKCVFIIDEINRGEISKIFGELFFSIDPGYRGESGRIDTQYQNMVEDGDAFKKGFFVPENVYIIGTMNDIDRSVESMDFAMRRRFAWKEVSADDSMQMLDGMANADEMKARMTSLNKAILAIKELGKAYQIGAAYFKKYELYNDFNKLWEYHLEGVLREYLRGNPNAEEQLKELKKAYDIESATDESDDTNE